MVKQEIKHPDEYEAIKRLFSPVTIEAETELSTAQIEKVNKLKTYSLLTGQSLLLLHIKEFMLLQKSKERKGIGEYVNAFISKKEQLLEKYHTLRDKMFG